MVCVYGFVFSIYQTIGNAKRLQRFAIYAKEHHTKEVKSETNAFFSSFTHIKESKYQTTQHGQDKFN